MVLPAPLGPISATSSRGFTDSEKSLTAVSPPNRMVAWRTSMSASLAVAAEAAAGSFLRRKRFQ